MAADVSVERFQEREPGLMRHGGGRLHRNHGDQRAGKPAQPRIRRAAGQGNLFHGGDPHRVSGRQARENIPQRVEVSSQDDNRVSRPQPLSTGHAVHAAQPLTEPRQQLIARPDNLPARRNHAATRSIPGTESKPNVDSRSKTLTSATSPPPSILAASA
jgi:hypothetical protein